MAAVTGPKAAQIFCEQRVVPRKPGLSSPIRTEGFIFLYYDEKEHSFMKEQLEKIRQDLYSSSGFSDRSAGTL